MSIQAMTRVIEGRVGDRGRKTTLQAMANYAGADGRAIFASVTTIAHDAECSEATVRRDIKQLLKDGWIRRGDQAHVAHIRGDRRPVVYDLAMDETTREAWKAEAARPVSLTPRGDEQTTTDQTVTTCQPDTPCEDPTGCQINADGVSETPSRGVTGDTQTVVTEEPSPRPPASGGLVSSTISCVRHPDAPGPNCRSCGTTNRQLEAAEKRRADEAARARARNELEEQRAKKAAARDAGRGPDVVAAIADARAAIRNRNQR